MKKMMMTLCLLLSMNARADIPYLEYQSHVNDADKTCLKVVKNWITKKLDDERYEGPNEPPTQPHVVRTGTLNYSNRSSENVLGAISLITYMQDDDGFESNTFYSVEVNYDVKSESCVIEDVTIFEHYCGWVSEHDYREGEVPCIF